MKEIMRSRENWMDLDWEIILWNILKYSIGSISGVKGYLLPFPNPIPPRSLGELPVGC